MKIISWNLAGMRAAVRKGLWHKMKVIDADVYCFQEVKARPEQVEIGFEYPHDYQSYWNPAAKAGYSGVATFTKIEPRISNPSVNQKKTKKSDISPTGVRLRLPILLP